MRLLREAGKCLLAPKVHNRVEKGSVELRDKGFLKRWGNSGNSVRLYFGGSKITADGDCSREIKRRLLLGRKVMANLDSILKSRDITLSTKVHLVKVMVFPVVMYGCESWTIKKAECWRIDAFELWCWRRPLRVPWTARRSNQSILKEISPGCSLEGLMLKLKLQYFGHLMGKADSFELGKIEGRIRRGWQRMRWFDGIADSMDMSLGKLRELRWTGRPCVLQFMGSQRVGHDWATKLNWTEKVNLLTIYRSVQKLFMFILFFIWLLYSVQFIHSVMCDSETPWTAACQASLSITNFWSFPKLMWIFLKTVHLRLPQDC